MYIHSASSAMMKLEEYLSNSLNSASKMGYSLYNAILISCKMY